MQGIKGAKMSGFPCLKVFIAANDGKTVKDYNNIRIFNGHVANASSTYIVHQFQRLSHHTDT